MTPRWSRLEQVALAAASLLAAGAFLRLHRLTAPAAAPAFGRAGLPTQLPPSGFGWWSYWDQWHYLQAVLAWSHGVLDPAWHWYLPGYPLIGAAFARLTPLDPFLLPDLGCLLAALCLFAGIAARLLPDVPHPRAIGAALFLAATILPPAVLYVWVEPWTTTPQIVGMYGCLLAGLRFLARPNRMDAFLAALAGTSVIGFRPADAAVIDVVTTGVSLGTLLARRVRPRALASCAVAASAGAALPLAVIAVPYVAVFGLASSAYVTLSAQIGFEWRLLPIRWVVLMLDPRPLLSAGQGLIGAFPWVASGIAGMAAALVASGGPGRPAHLLVIGAVAGELAVLLCYRDLHPTELWRFELYHYFKWLLPIAALYSAVLLATLLRRHLRRPRRVGAALAALATVPVLLMWRAELADPQPLDRPVFTPSGGATIRLPHGLGRLDTALLVRAATDWDRADNDAGTIEQSGRRTRRLLDLKGYPLDGGFLVVPLRPLPAAPGSFDANPLLRLDPAAAPLLVRQRVIWGLPCLLWPDRTACDQSALLPPASLPATGTIDFGHGGDADLWTVSGWSHQEAGGRWTDGAAAVLRFELPENRLGPAGVAIGLLAHGYAPAGLPAAAVSVFANGHPVARWTAGAATQTLRAVIAPAWIGPRRSVTLRLAIDPPRRPIDHGGGTDGRRLGLFVFSLQAAPEATSPP